MYTPSQLVQLFSTKSVDPLPFIQDCYQSLTKDTTVSPVSDVYKSLDYFCHEYIDSNLNAPPLSSALIKTIPLPDNNSPSTSSLDLGFLLDVCSNSDLFSPPKDITFSLASEISVYYHPLMIGYYSSFSLHQLGWGSSKFASLVACKRKNNNPSIDGKICVILTRHGSKYAHFVRDRLTKIVWAQFYSGYGPFDTFIFDFPLSAAELDLLRKVDFKSKIFYASNLLSFTLQGDVMVIKSSSGMSLLPWLRKFVNEHNSFSQYSHKAKKRLFFTRGIDGGRRDALNAERVEETFKHFGFEIINPSNYSIHQQLSLARDSSVASGFHGAQLINSFNSKSLIELHSYPYAFSPWAQTMRSMASTLKINYIPVICGFPETIPLNLYSSIADICSFHSSFISSDPSSGQSQKFDVDIDGLSRSLRSCLQLLPC